MIMYFDQRVQDENKCSYFFYQETRISFMSTPHFPLRVLTHHASNLQELQGHDIKGNF